MRKNLRAGRLLLGFALRADALRAIGTFVLSASVAIGGLGLAYAEKVLTDAALARSWRDCLTWAGIMSGAWAVTYVAAIVNLNWSTVVGEKTGFLIDRELMELSAGIWTLEPHERPAYADEIAVLRQQRWGLGGALWAMANSLQVVVRIFGTALLLAEIHPVLLVLPAFGLPTLYVSARTAAMQQKVADAVAERGRVTRHLFRMATTAESGKELRIFGLHVPVAARYEGLFREVDAEATAVGVRAGLLQALGWTIFGLGYAGALAFVAIRAVTHPGQVSVGDLVMTISLAWSVHSIVSSSAGFVNWLWTSLKTASRFLWLSDYALDAALPPATSALPDRLERGIELRDVTFRYPGTEHDVLSGVNLTIPAGATVALVGDNGAGKTTLVKLLARFYDPTSGQVLVDGVDLRTVDVASWRAAMSAGFQDFARYELPAREAVGVGWLDKIDDRAWIAGALGRASAAEVVDQLPDGLDSQLGRSFEGGVELSGGQWQKLALGRAMMRPDPLLLLLDEPTAALDAQTEHALFERYAGAARRAAATNGGITVLVSHRFSTVRMADLIVVVHGGRVTEAGSHAELMTAGGLYAELYSIQARAYT